MEQIEKIKDKIAKLIRKAEGTDSVEEASTFLKKANDLLMQYKLSRADIKLDTDEEEEVGQQFIYIDEVHNWGKSDGDWMLWAYTLASRLNLCQLTNRKYVEFRRDEAGQYMFSQRTGEPFKDHKWRLRLIGLEMDREVTMYMASSIINQLNNLYPKAWKEYQRIGGHEKRNAFKRAYFRGAVLQLMKIMEDYQEVQREQLGENLTALVKTTEIRVRDYMNKNVSIGRGRSASQYSADGGGSMGRRDAYKVSINKGISNSSSIGRKLIG